MAKNVRKHYYQWLKNERDYELFNQLMDCSNAIKLMASQLIESGSLTYNGFLKLHKKILGGLLFEIERLEKTKEAIGKKANLALVIDIKKYKSFKHR